MVAIVGLRYVLPNLLWEDLDAHVLDDLVPLLASKLVTGLERVNVVKVTVGPCFRSKGEDTLGEARVPIIEDLELIVFRAAWTHYVGLR